MTPESNWSVAQSCPTLCNPMDCSLQGSSVHGISQAGIVEWVAISSSRGSFWPRDWNHVCAQASWTKWVRVTQLCPTLHYCMDHAVHGILQARILEWEAFPLSRRSSSSGIQPRSPALQADSLPAEPPGKPFLFRELKVEEKFSFQPLSRWYE